MTPYSYELVGYFIIRVKKWSKKNYDILSEIIGHMLIDYSLIMINDDHKNRENGTTAFKSSDFIDA